MNGASVPLVLLMMLAGIAAVGATADTVKLANKPAFRKVTIADMRGDRLVFRGLSQQYLKKPLAEVDWIAIDGRPDLNAAEQAAFSGRWPEALAGYERAIRTADAAWLHNFIRLRMLRAADRSGAFERTVELYLELLRDQPVAARQYTPQNPGPPGSEANAAARCRLLEALQVPAMSETMRSACATLLLELALFDDVPDVPAILTPASPGHGSPATPPRPQRGILPMDDRPASASAPAASARPQLAADSWLYGAVEQALAAGEHERAARITERALPFASETDRAAWDLLQGRCRIAAGRCAEAADALLRLSQTARDKDPVLSAWALYYVGVAHEAMNRSDVAEQLYRELAEGLASQGLRDGPSDADLAAVRSAARAALERLGAPTRN